MESGSRGRQGSNQAPVIPGISELWREELVSGRPEEVRAVRDAPLMMGEAAREAAREAGLDMCDMRVSYRDNRTSTPSRERICLVENVYCWDERDEASLIQPKSRQESLTDSPGPCPGLCDSPVSITLSRDLEASRESRPDIDLSYGGAWAVEEEPTLVDGLYNFGISVFDSLDDQVSRNSIRTGLGLTRVIPGQLNQCQSSENQSQNALKLEKVGKLKSSLRRDLEEKDATENILEMKDCHKKSKADTNDEVESNVDDFRQRNLRIFVNNVRGWFSKRESAEAIFIKNKIDVFITD